MGQTTTGSIGRRAEQLAFDYLVDRGLKPVTRNSNCRGDEINLIMLHDHCLAFIEGRFRKSNSFVTASHTVDRHKQKRMIRTAPMFIAKFRRRRVSYNPAIEWVADAFRPND